MPLPKYIEIDGKRHAWRDILRMRREQRDAAKKPQLTLFALQEDARPASQKTADGRYQEPLLFND